MPYFDWNGHSLYYREQGDGPLFLLLPGNTASSACHGGELDHFGGRFHVAVLDFLGTGGSGRVAEWADDWWEQGAHQARALVEHLGYGQCIAVGTSGGGVAALLLAILYPQVVRGVVADSCAATFPEDLLREVVAPGRAQRTEEQVAFWEQAHGLDWEQVVDADTGMMRRFAAGGGDWFGSRLGEVCCPVLLTASKRDPLLHRAVRQLGEMAERIEGCRLYLHHEGEHPLMWSRAATFRHVADRFLHELEGEDG